MPYCPNCRTEYREGFDTCADCHIPLVEELPALPEQLEQAPPRDLGEPALLTTVDNMLDAEMLLNMLQEQGIPAFKKSRGMGGYLSIYMNAAYTGLQIYVPQTLLEQAQGLAAAYLPQTVGAEAPELS